MAVKQITLRAWSNNSDVAPVEINQGDILSRTVVFTLLDSTGAPIDLTLSSVRVHFSKPDGTVAYLTASVVNGPAGMAAVTLDSQCTAVPGTVKSIVQITGSGGNNLFITGAVFIVGAINVEGSIISANDFTALTDALAQVQGIANKADKSTKINGHSLAADFDISADEVKAVPKTRTIANLPLSDDITLAQLGGLLFPVGSTCIRTDSVNPGTIYGGTWSVYAAGKMLVGVDLSDTDFNSAGKTGGSKDHTHGLTNAVAAINLNAIGNFTELQQNAPSDYTITGYRPIGTLTPGGGNSSVGTALIGNTDSKSLLPPYVTCYMWQRTA